MRRHSSQFSLILILGTLMLGAVVSSCGSDEDGAGAAIPRITDPGTTVSFADLEAIGFKKSKEYPVEGLTGVSSAYFGFWGPDPYEREDYEVRFFKTHSDAVELGTELVSERVGENAKLEEDNSNWPVGLKDARRCTGSKAYSGPQNCLTPKYWDYSIYANMILLCSGGNVETASILCNDLLTALQPQPDEA